MVNLATLVDARWLFFTLLPLFSLLIIYCASPLTEYFFYTSKLNLQTMDLCIILKCRLNRYTCISQYIPRGGGIGRKTSKYPCDYDFCSYNISAWWAGDIHGWLLFQSFLLSRVFRSVKCDSHCTTCIGICVCILLLSEIDQTRADVIQGFLVLSERFIFFVLFDWCSWAWIENLGPSTFSESLYICNTCCIFHLLCSHYWPSRVKTVGRPDEIIIMI